MPARLPLPPLFRALYQRPFALLWSGQTLSRVGDFVYQLALVWWVREATGSAVAMGMVMVFSMTPMILFLLLGGVVVDRLPRIRLMFASDIGRGVIMLLVALLAQSGQLEIWHVYVVSVLFGFADAFFQPAYVAAVPQMTPAEDWPSANSLSSLSMHLGRIAGPAIGAIIVGMGGTQLAFGINAASFFVSAVLLLPLLGTHVPLPEKQVVTVQGILRDLGDGWRVVLTNPVLYLTIMIAALGNITLAGPFSISMPFLFDDVKTLGLVMAVFPAGYILGSIWSGWQTRLRRRGLLGYSGLVLAGLGLMVFGLPVPLALLVIGALVNGAALEIFGMVWANLLQELVPNELLGRVSSIDMLGSFVLLPIGFGLTGWATEAWGAPLMFLLGGGLSALLALSGLLHPAIRNLD